LFVEVSCFVDVLVGVSFAKREAYSLGIAQGGDEQDMESKGYVIGMTNPAGITAWEW
jgi:hypothetical protein